MDNLDRENEVVDVRPNSGEASGSNCSVADGPPELVRQYTAHSHSKRDLRICIAAINEILSDFLNLDVAVRIRFEPIEKTDLRPEDMVTIMQVVQLPPS